MCFDQYTGMFPGYMASNGVMSAPMSRDNELAMHERIRQYYVASYRALPEKSESEPACEGSVEEKEECRLGRLHSFLHNAYVGTAKENEKYAIILASLKKGADVDTSFSAPRTYKGLDGVAAVIAGVSVFVPDVGYAASRTDIFFFRRDGKEYRLAGVAPVGEDWKWYESGGVDMFKRGDAKPEY